MSNQEITALEQQIAELTAKLNGLRKDAAPEPVPDHRFAAPSLPWWRSHRAVAGRHGRSRSASRRSVRWAFTAPTAAV